jgi:hypothetical protein
MKTSALLPALVLITVTAGAAGIDMDDPRRALGREGDVRIDAQLVRESIGPGMPIGITYQIQNLSASPIAIAHKVMEASYDEDTRTVTLTVGSEVPPDGNMPAMVLIAPGEKRLLQAAATPAMSVSAIKPSSGGGPRFVQVKVAILRDLAPFLPLIQQQAAQQSARTKQRLTDEQFEKWFEANDTIFLNAVPVQYTPKRDTMSAEAGEGRGTY